MCSVRGKERKIWWISNISLFYSDGVPFESRKGYWLICVFMVSSTPPKKLQRLSLKLSQERSLSWPFHYVIHYHTLECCTVWTSDRIITYTKSRKGNQRELQQQLYWNTFKWRSLQIVTNLLQGKGERLIFVWLHYSKYTGDTYGCTCTNWSHCLAIVMVLKVFIYIFAILLIIHNCFYFCLIIGYILIWELLQVCGVDCYYPKHRMVIFRRSKLLLPSFKLL